MRKIMISLCMIVLFACMVGSVAYAADNFSLTAHEAETSSEFSNVIAKGTGIGLAVVRYVGAGIALISIVLIAMKYLFSSPGEKADYKKNLVVFAVGGVGMFAVGTIIELIMKLSEQIVAS